MIFYIRKKSNGIILIGLLTCMETLSGCSGLFAAEQQNQPVYKTWYRFTSGTNHFLDSAEPIRLARNMPVRDVLDSLGRQLADTYFNRYGNRTNQDSIYFDIQSVQMSSPGRYHAVINMIDASQFALFRHFQGSFGGQVTYVMLIATFTQPQADPPLLDSFELLYNGLPGPDLDHIELSHTLKPNDVKDTVMRLFE